MKKIIVFSSILLHSLSCFSDVNPADINKDGQVSAADLNLLVPKFQQLCVCMEDINGDGRVSAADLNLLIPLFGKKFNVCSNDALKNAVLETTYDEDNQKIIISETKTYSDKLGRETQSLMWNISDNVILGTQTVFDGFGRNALRTLSAPTTPPAGYPATTFCYSDLFASNTSNAKYSYTDFDIASATPSLDKLNNPNPVNNSNAGTLGWYYSNNNTSEPYVATSSFPYTRTEYYADPLNRVKRITGVGENYRMGSGHEQQVYYMSNAGELYYAFGYKGAAIIELEDNNAAYKTNENLSAIKTITVDPDGKVSISYRNLSGLNIATCRSGAKDAGCTNQKVSQNMYYAGEKGVSIHLPPSCNGTLKITGDATGPQPNYQITDLSTGKVLQSVTDYTYNPTTGYVAFSSSYQNKHLFLRISYDYPATVQPNYSDYRTVWYELDYDNWSLQLYDIKGRPAVTVPPVAINCAYDLTVNNTTIHSNRKYNTIDFYPYLEESLETVTLDTMPGINKDLFYTISCPSIFFGSPQIENSTTTYDITAASATSNIPQLESSEIDGPPEPVNTPQFSYGPIDPNLRPLSGAIALTFKLFSNNVELPVAPSILYMNINYSRDKTIPPPGNPYIIQRIDSIPGAPAFFALPNYLIKKNKYADIELRLTNIQASATNIMGANAGPPYIYYTDSDFYSDTSIIGKLIKGVVQVQKIRVQRQLLSYTTPIPYNKALTTSTFYNKLGWPIKTISPDEGTVNRVYDTEGKVRFIQNQQQAAEDGKFTYINYDHAGRVVETGEYNPQIGTLPGRPRLSFIPYNEGGGIPAGSNTVHSIVDLLDLGVYVHQLAQQTYFRYDLPQADFPAGLNGYDQNYKDGQLVKTSNSIGSSWFGYNSLSQTTWKVNTINGLGTKTVNYTYTKDGQVDKVDYQKETSPERFVHQYLYDADKRFKEVKTSFDNFNFSSNQVLKYYLHGPLKRNELGGNLQGLDYVHTITGQLKSVNDPTLTNRDPGKDSYSNSFKKDAFGFTLDYFNGDYIRQNTFIETYTPGSGNTALPNLYSGQIRAMRWQTTLPTAALATSTHVNEVVQYVYEYDYKNQLDKAIFAMVTPGTINGPTTGSSPTFVEGPNEYGLDDIVYDKNGNLKHLLRKGKYWALLMDILTYNYSSTIPNRLTSISDAANIFHYTDDIRNQPANNYQYNNNGQLLKDVQADYNYEYNLAGNVTVVKKTNNVLIASFEYNETGLRQKKVSYNTSGAASKFTWYVYDATGTLLSTYETNAGVTAQTELHLYGAGRLGVYNKTLGSYIYELTDHLGNVRSTIRNNSGNLEVLSFADYYPHGSMMPDRNYIASPGYKYGYQGQEKDNETGFVNFELRQYDPRIGRWFNPDPMHQYHSPYLAMGNNPISFIDPTGGQDGAIVDIIVPRNSKNYDPYGFFSGQGHFYQTKQMDANGDEFSGTYSTRITPDQEAANKQRMQDEARDHEGNSFTTLQQNQYDNRKTTPWQWDDPKPASAWDYVMTREENNSIALTELNLLSFAIPVGQLFQAFRGAAAFARAGKWGASILSKSEMAGVVGKGVSNGFKTLSQLGLKDGMAVSSSKALGLGEEFLGVGYKELVPGSGRYVSADGARVFRMGESDILGFHGGGPHVNFETLIPNPSKIGKMIVDLNLHIYIHP